MKKKEDIDNDNDSSDEKNEDKKGGRKKKKGNGHKPNCKCPICNNMRKKKGGDPVEEPALQEPDIENQKGDIEEAGVKSTSGSDLQNNTTSSNETPASSSDYDALDAAEKGEAGQNVVGGTRKRRRGKKRARKSRRSNKRN